MYQKFGEYRVVVLGEQSVTEQNVTKAKTKNRKSIVFHLPYLSSVLEVEMMN